MGITFSLNREQIGPTKVMRSLLILSFLLVLSATLSSTTAHNVNPPKCAPECCRQCHQLISGKWMTYCSQKYNEPKDGCGIGNYCNDHCQSLYLVKIFSTA